jgi:hypothetical protein
LTLKLYGSKASRSTHQKTLWRRHLDGDQEIS